MWILIEKPRCGGVTGCLLGDAPNLLKDHHLSVRQLQLDEGDADCAHQLLPAVVLVVS